ncbi:MAG: hypothetical protein P8H57_01885 [Emcibacteraceae bacterium]|nr:hypothetical protein [Emcibacteraceae bacterium]
MIEPEHLAEIVDFTQKTWGLKNNHLGILDLKLRMIIEKCINEQFCAIDYKNQSSLDELEAALNNLKKGLVKIEDNYTHRTSTLTFLGAENYLTGPRNRSHILTGNEEIKELQLSLNKNIEMFEVWLKKQLSNPSPQKYVCSRIIINDLLPLYSKLTGLDYKANYVSDERGKRRHNSFTRVAILIDALYGNPRPELINIPKLKNGKINISDIVDCDPSFINNFCRFVEDVSD